MYYLIAKKIIVPWTLISACMVSVVLYLITGSVNMIPHARAASTKGNPTTGIVTILEKYADPETGSQAEPDNQHQKATNTPLLSGHQACEVDSRFPDSIQKWCHLISRYANHHRLDPDLIAAVIWQESGGNPVAYSKSGAVGLMQVMPRDGLAASFQCKNGPCFENRPTIVELEDPEFNVSFGTEMLANLVQHLGSTRDALKAYGPMDVGYFYADKVLTLKATYGD
jgi:hypothetical protein